MLPYATLLQEKLHELRLKQSRIASQMGAEAAHAGRADEGGAVVKLPGRPSSLKPMSMYTDSHSDVPLPSRAENWAMLGLGSSNKAQEGGATAMSGGKYREAAPHTGAGSGTFKIPLPSMPVQRPLFSQPMTGYGVARSNQL